VINPVAAVSITDRQLRRDIREVLNEIGVQQFNCQNLNYVRFLPRKNVLCAISDLPGEVMAVTALGFDGIIYTQFGNQAFSWHLRATDLNDLRTGVARMKRIWMAKQA
jgi:hypothetical protein